MDYRFRPPTPDDLPAVIELVRALELADYGEAEDPTQWLGIIFRLADLDRDAWLVESPDGEVVAGGSVRVRHPTRIRSFGGVLPDHRGRGLGSALLERMEARARELARNAPPEAEVWLGQDSAVSNESARRLFESRGFELIRHFWKMGIDLDEEPPEPHWPDGIRLVHAQRGQEREVFDASEDSFQDHWDHQPHDYDEWRAWMVDAPSYDPSLWLLAREGDEIAGLSLCSADADEGWVGVLGTRRPWRRKGIAKALLLASFRELRNRGKPRAVLGVDAANPTGATELYRGVGMRVLFESVVYRKIIAP